MKVEKDAQFEELKSKMTRLELKVEELAAENQQQQSLIVVLQQQIEKLTANSIPSSVYSKNIIESKPDMVAAAMPKSCADLRYFGHTINGLYLIMGTENVETVFCDFSLIPSDPSNIIFISTVIKLIYLSTTRCRFPDFDRTSRRQITACLLLRSEN